MLELAGTNFGGSGGFAGSTVGLSVGSFIVSCIPTQWTATSLKCAAPSGVGSGLVVRVRVGG